MMEILLMEMGVIQHDMSNMGILEQEEIEIQWMYVGNPVEMELLLMELSMIK